MNKFCLILLCICFAGCSESHRPAVKITIGQKKSAPKTWMERFGIGGPSKEEIAAQKELEAQQLKEQQELAVQQLKDADVLVAKWTDIIQETATKDAFGFKKMEGLTEADPWGNQIKVNYHQVWFDEIATIQSAGPDGIYGNNDDLTRTRSAKNPAGLFQGISTFGWVVFAWLFCGGCAWAFSSGVGHRRLKKGKSNRHRHPVMFALATIIFAPVAMFMYGMQFIGGSLGARGPFYDGFEFDFVSLIDIGSALGSAIPDIDIDL